MVRDPARVRRFLTRDGDFVSEDLRHFREESAVLQGEVAALIRENNALRARIAPLERRIVELECKLKKVQRVEIEPEAPDPPAVDQTESEPTQEQTI